MSDNELIFLLALQQLSNIGDSTAKKLLQHLGSAEAIFKEKKQNLLKIEGIGSIKVKDLHNPDHIEAAEKELQANRLAIAAAAATA